MRRWLLLALLCLPVAAHATVTTTTFSVSYTCTGSVGPYAFTFPISDPTAMTVIENGNTLPSTAWTSTPVNNNYENGGSVSLVTVCPSGQTLILERNTPVLQLTLFTDNMPTPFSSFMYALDKLTEIAQEQAASSSANTATCPSGQALTSVVGPICLASIVQTVNGLTGAVTLQAGANTAVTTSGQIITIASTGGGGGGGPTLQHNGVNLANQALLNFNDTTPAPPEGAFSVNFVSNSGGALSGYVTAPGYTSPLSYDPATQFVSIGATHYVASVNALAGAVVFAAGSNVTLTPSGQTITIAATGNGSVASGTLGCFAWYASSGTTVGCDPNIDDGVTTAGTITSNESFAVNNTSAPSQISLTPTTHAPTVVAGATTRAAPQTIITAGTYVDPQSPGTGTFVGTNTAGVVQETIIQRLAGTPTFATGTGAGTGGTITIACASGFQCTDKTGVLQVLTGTSPASTAAVFTITFAGTYSVTPICGKPSPADATTDALPIGGTPHWSEGTSTSTVAAFLIGANALSATTTYYWTYSCDLPL